MTDTVRNYLHEGQVIALSDNPKKEVPRRYRICAYVGEGGSAVCYDAVREDDGKSGKLKEFFPARLQSGRQNIRLIRQKSGELILAAAGSSPAPAGPLAASADSGASASSAAAIPSDSAASSVLRAPADPLAASADSGASASSAAAIPSDSTASSVSCMPAASPAAAAFTAMKADYVQAFYLLNRTIAEADENQVLKNYIQDSEILYGGDTVYIWTAGAAGEGFDRYIARVRRNPQDESDFRLQEILSVMLSLTDCMKALHTAGLMYLDLKPSNFLVRYDSEQHIDASGVSLFDINTLYPADSRLPLPGGTPGFSAPELFCAPEAVPRRSAGAIAAGRRPHARRSTARAAAGADNRADIYSLGAILFYAIVISDDAADRAALSHAKAAEDQAANCAAAGHAADAEDQAADRAALSHAKAAEDQAAKQPAGRASGGLYSPEMYGRLEELVRTSRLIAGTASGADEELVSLLVRILKKSLADRPADRYVSAGEMLADLQKARLYSEQYAVKKSVIGYNRRLSVTEANEQGAGDPDIVLRKLLAVRPLYAALRGNPEKTNIRVLIVGEGEYAAKFADICLETGQLDGIDLDITMVCTSPADAMAKYRQTRPETENFVRMDACSGEEETGGLTRSGKTAVQNARIGQNAPAPDRSSAVYASGIQSEKPAVQNARIGQNAPAPDGGLYGALHFCSRPHGSFDFVLVALGDSAENKTEAGKICAEIRKRKQGDRADAESAGRAGEQSGGQTGEKTEALADGRPADYVVPVCFITGDARAKETGKNTPADSAGVGGDSTGSAGSTACKNSTDSAGSTVCKNSKGSAGSTACKNSKGSAGSTACEDSTGLYPVYIGEAVTPADIHPQLAQMAFNTHICWNNSLNLNMEEEQKKFFADTYSYSASLASAVTIPYKLYSAGIDEENPKEAARRFSAEILEKKDTDPEAAKKFQMLTALEHRRWVLHMAADGWRAPRGEDGRLDLRACEVSGKAKNVQDHTHACMVPSRADAPLSSKEWQADHFAKWDDPAADLDALDELDRLSAELYRRHKKRADALRRKNPLDGGDMESVQKIAEQCGGEAKEAFTRYRFCLRNMLNGVESYARQWDACERELQDAAERALHGQACRAGVPAAELIQELKLRLSLIRRDFAPAAQACLHTDYKAKDEVLIGKIPFILTYQNRPELVIAFNDGAHANGRASALFQNVASATLLCPKKLHYLYYCGAGKNDGLADTAKKLGRCLQYLQSRGIRAKVYLAAAVAVEAGAGEEAKKTAEACFAAGLHELLPAGAGSAEAEAGRLLAGAGSAEAGTERGKTAAENAAADVQNTMEGMPGPGRLAGLKVFACTGAADAADKFLAYVQELDAPLCDGSSALFPSPAENAAYTAALLQAAAGTSSPVQNKVRTAVHPQNTEGTVFPAKNTACTAAHPQDNARAAFTEQNMVCTEKFSEVPKKTEVGKNSAEGRMSGPAYFEFTAEKKTFTRCLGCSGLTYLQDDTGLRIRDMFALSGARDIRYAYPDFLEEQDTLWELYKADPPAWNRLCSLVETYEENRRPLAEFPVQKSAESAAGQQPAPGQAWETAETTAGRQPADERMRKTAESAAGQQPASGQARETAETTAGRQPAGEQMREPAEDAGQCEVSCILPDFLAGTAKKMAGELACCGVIGPHPKISRISGGRVSVRLRAAGEYRNMLEHLFAPGNLMRGLYGFRVYEQEDFAGGRVCVSAGSLETEDLDLGAADMPGRTAVMDPGTRVCARNAASDAGFEIYGRNVAASSGQGAETGERRVYAGSKVGLPGTGDVYGLLLRLEESGYISGLRQNPMHPSQVSFFWSSEKIKTMLGSAAEILKLHTYDQVLKTGYFDDVLCNYRFRWENSAAEDTLDLVLTKGFRSVMISCIGSPDAEAEAYHKLYSIADHFGIGAKKVIIRSFSREDDRTCSRKNERQSARGAGLGILTISDPADIENIGEVLAAL